jgi:hypothetical protein
MVLNVSGILYSNLPENMLLAGIRSLVGFAGIFIIHMDPHTYVFRKRTKN